MPDSPVPPPPGVGRTALGVARIRASESARPDRLFDDDARRDGPEVAAGYGRPGPPSGGSAFVVAVRDPA